MLSEAVRPRGERRHTARLYAARRATERAGFGVRRGRTGRGLHDGTLSEAVRPRGERGHTARIYAARRATVRAGFDVRRAVRAGGSTTARSPTRRGRGVSGAIRRGYTPRGGPRCGPTLTLGEAARAATSAPAQTDKAECSWGTGLRGLPVVAVSCHGVRPLCQRQPRGGPSAGTEKAWLQVQPMLQFPFRFHLVYYVY